MKLALVRTLALSISLGFAGFAAAQGSVSSPFEDSVCMSPLEVTGSLVDPNGFYADAPNCPKLCSKAVKDCKQYVKDAASCEKSEIRDDASYAKTECEVEFEHGTETKTCKTEIEHSSGDDQASAQADRNAALQTCDDWGSTCAATCP